MYDVKPQQFIGVEDTPEEEEEEGTGTYGEGQDDTFQTVASMSQEQMQMYAIDPSIQQMFSHTAMDQINIQE